jgi:hypothetical protein
MARGLVPRGHLLASCHRERSVNCHGEESFKTTRPSCFCHYERSEVIQKQVLLAKRLLLLLRSIASDKVLGQEPLGSRLPRRVFYTSRNDKKCRIKNTPSRVTSRWQVFSQVTRDLFAI